MAAMRGSIIREEHALSRIVSDWFRMVKESRRKHASRLSSYLRTEFGCEDLILSSRGRLIVSCAWPV